MPIYTFSNTHKKTFKNYKNKKKHTWWHRKGGGCRPISFLVICIRTQTQAGPPSLPSFFPYLSCFFLHCCHVASPSSHWVAMSITGCLRGVCLQGSQSETLHCALQVAIQIRVTIVSSLYPNFKLKLVHELQ